MCFMRPRLLRFWLSLSSSVKVHAAPNGHRLGGSMTTNPISRWNFSNGQFFAQWKCNLVGIMVVLFAIIGCLCVGVGPALAQSVDDPNLEIGFKPFGGFEGGNIDTVNLENLHLNLHIPLVSYPQRGGRLTLSFSLMYRWPLWKWRYLITNSPRATYRPNEGASRRGFQQIPGP